MVNNNYYFIQNIEEFDYKVHGHVNIIYFSSNFLLVILLKLYILPCQNLVIF
jgi:hypothetical protein